MVRFLAGFITLLLSLSCVSAGKSVVTIESAFQTFFGEPMKLVMGDKEVKLVVNPIEENAAVIPVRMVFDVAAVEKVLLLKLKNTGYMDTAYLNKACADETVFVAAFNLDPHKNISELETRISTHCWADNITLLLWARTRDGRYYSISTRFRTTTESPG